MRRVLPAASLLILLIGINSCSTQEPPKTWRDAISGSEQLFNASDLLDSARKNSTQTSSIKTPAAALQGENSVIVVDAGSSGTRVYKIKFKAKNKICVFHSSEELLRSDQALAQSAPEALPLLLEQLSKKYPEIKQQEIRTIATGGFRTLDRGDGQNCGSLCSRKKREITSALEKTWPNASLHVASGEEEAKLSWLSVSVLNSSSDHASVEIGNSTVQVAFQEAGRLKGQMAAIGSGALHAVAPECELPVRDYSACLAAVEKLLLENEASRQIYQADLKGAGDVVGLGGDFRNLEKLDKHFLDYKTGDFNPREDIQRVETLARKLCRQDAAELLKSGALHPSHVRKTCTQLVMGLLFIKKLGINRISEASLEVGAAFAGFSEFQPDIANSCKNYSSSL